MGIRSFPFGQTPCGQHALLFELSIGDRFVVGITNYGAALQKLICPDRNARLADVALGYRDASQMQRGCGYLGATIGRIAGRVSRASFELGGRIYQLSRNDGPQHLHGGTCGFSHRIWNHSIADDQIPSVTFHLRSENGDQGYPGCLSVSLNYRLESPGRLILTFAASADLTTPFNPTSHAYFNLDGHNAGTIADHELQLFAAHRTLTDDALLPTGQIEPVAGTAFDFRSSRRIFDQPIERGGGFDQTYIVDDPSTTLRPVAVLKSRHSGRIMKVDSDRPCIHLYTGGFLDLRTAKDGTEYRAGSGLSLETQGYPDAVNRPEFPAEFVSPDTPFQSRTHFTFTTENDL